jgi:ribosomal protein S1
MKAWDDLEKAYRDGTSVKGRVIDRIKGGLRVTSMALRRSSRLAG